MQVGVKFDKILNTLIDILCPDTDSMDKIMNNMDVFQYLTSYGYVNDEQKGSFINPDEGLVEHMKEALLEFQSYAGINQTGVMDPNTVKMMMMPRCGVKDIIGNYSKSNVSNR